MRQTHKMIKHTQTIRRQFADDLFEVFNHFMGLTLKGLRSVLITKSSWQKKF